MAKGKRDRFKAHAVNMTTGIRTPIDADLIEIHTEDGVLAVGLKPQGAKGRFISMATGSIVTAKKNDHSTLGIHPTAANMMFIELHSSRKGK